MSICLADARAAASRRNGAQSCGPKTLEGKARSSQNALKHGLRVDKFVVVGGGEDAAAFAALETALSKELTPDGALCRACWQAASPARPGGSSAPSASRPSCSRATWAAAISGWP
jgi:hypothetical protein